MPDLNQKNKPNYKNSDYDRIAADIKLVRHVFGGTKAMRAANKLYLPQEPRETSSDYNARLNRTVFFDAYRKTVESLVGVVTKREITIGDDVPARIRSDLEDIDLCGNHLDVFVKRHFTDQFEGYAFILVDMESSLPPSATLADERALNRRPYWVKYKATDVLNWRTDRINGKEQFTQITFEERTCEPDGEYGEKEVIRYRTFRLVNGLVEWELNRYNPDGKTDDEKIVFEKRGTTTLKRIPVAVSGEIGKPPPLLGLAYLNISHWQNVSDQENILHITRVPQLVRIGAKTDQNEQVVGVSGTMDLPINANAFWLEVKSDGAMKVGREHLLDIEQRMGMMGLSTLTQRTGSDVTATEKTLDYKEKLSELATMARSEKDAVELALSFHAEYYNLPEGGSIELGVAEENLTLSPQHMTFLLASLTAGKLSLETFLNAVLKLLDEAGVLAEDVTVEDEVARITEAQKVAQSVSLPPLAKKIVRTAPPGIQNLFGAQTQ